MSFSTEYMEMDTLYHRMVASDFYMVEELLGGGYSSADVHRWGRMEECRGLYGKIRDMVSLRCMKAVEKEKLDRGMYGIVMAPYGVIDTGDVEAGWNLSEGDRRMLERAGVYDYE